MVEIATVSENGQHILYDAARLTKFDPRLFDPEFLRQQGYISGSARGRGQTLFFNYAGQQWVLRHYRRGGLVAAWLGDRYLWVGLRYSRAWREWRLLADLHAIGLPVPAPVAARVRRDGVWARADLITVQIADSAALSALLAQRGLPADRWRGIGSTIRCFHDAGVRHADLNAHNILLTPQQVYVIDFDRGRRCGCRQVWKSRNLQRLLRSLRKLAGSQAPFYFTDADWRALLDGYHGR